jgi:hypothetical protein
VVTYTPTAIAQVKQLYTEITPNPASSFIHLFIQPVASNNFTVILADAAGKTVLTCPNVQPTITYTLDVSHLVPGAYLLTIKNDELVHTEKIIIQR